jgi:hypothetical protein
MPMSPNEAQGDSRLRLVIGVAPPRPGLCAVALGHAQVPARGKRVGSRLREELSNDGSEANGIKLSLNVRYINMLRVSRPELRELIRAMHGGMTG